MKTTYILTFLWVIAVLCIVVGCDDTATYPKRPDGSKQYAHSFEKLVYEGHTYVVYARGFHSSSVGGFIHDPDCSKCRQ